MRAVVLEIKGYNAALLLDDGTIVKRRNRNFTVGDVVNIKGNSMRRYSAIAAVAMFVMLLGGGGLAYATPYYYVSLDVNPSILIEVNQFERVISVKATNEDAEAILAGLNLKHMDIEAAINQAVDRITDAGYLGEDVGAVSIASSAKNDDKAERLATKLKQVVEEENSENGVVAEVAARVTGYEMVQKAKALGITPGRYNIITNLLGEEIGENINEPIKDLMARYTANKKAQKNANEAARSDDELIDEQLDELRGKGNEKEARGQNMKGANAPSSNGNPANKGPKENKGIDKAPGEMGKGNKGNKKTE